MKLARKVGVVSQIFQVFIRDSSSTVGAGLGSLVFNTSSLVSGYHRNTDSTGTAITLATMTEGTFTSSGFKVMTGTGIPTGCYQFCPPDAAFASGATSVFFWLSGATNMAPLLIEVDLDAQVDVTFWNGTVVATPATAGIPDINVKNINNVAAATPGAAGGLFIAGTNAATTITTGLTTHFIGTLDVLTTYTGNTLQTGDGFARLGAPAGASVSADIAVINAKTTNLPSDPADESLIIAATDAIMARVGAPVGASISADIAAVQSDADNIQTRIPTALVGGRIDASVGAVATAASNIKKNTAIDISFPMTDSTTHALATGLTVTATRSIDGAAFGACANAVTEVGSGVYNVVLAAADTNGNSIMYLFTAAASDPRLLEVITQP